MNKLSFENFLIMDDRHVSTQYLKINKKDRHNIVSETDPCNFQFLITEFKMGFQKKIAENNYLS